MKRFPALPWYRRSQAGGKDIAAKIESFKGMINAVKKSFPNAQVYGTTLDRSLAPIPTFGAPSWPKGPTGRIHRAA
jgi:hypothetical protein